MAVAAAATAVLPPRAAAVAMKTPAATAMVGAQTTFNNQLKSATAMETATMTATKMRMETKAKAAAEARRQCGGGGQLGGGGSSLAKSIIYESSALHGTTVEGMCLTIFIGTGGGKQRHTQRG
jgi:hypothetical protein